MRSVFSFLFALLGMFGAGIALLSVAAVAARDRATATTITDETTPQTKRSEDELVLLLRIHEGLLGPDELEDMKRRLQVAGWGNNGGSASGMMGGGGGGGGMMGGGGPGPNGYGYGYAHGQQPQGSGENTGGTGGGTSDTTPGTPFSSSVGRQDTYGYGHGYMGGGGGMLRGGGGGGGTMNGAVMGTIRYLFQNIDTMTRTVTKTDTGATAITESTDPDVANAIYEHISDMQQLHQQGKTPRPRDPLFRALASHHADLTLEKQMVGSNTVKSELVGTDACTVALAQAHANVVSEFIDNGMSEMHRLHSIPGECKS